jgi:hypothetical protein
VVAFAFRHASSRGAPAGRVSTIQPALLVTPLPKRFPHAPGSLPANYVAPASLRAFLVLSYLRWRRRAPIGR